MADIKEEDNIAADETDTDTQQQGVEEQLSVIDTLSGQQKATALLVAMGKSTAGRLIKHFSADDLRRLRGLVRNLPDIKMQDFEKLVRQFENAFAEGASFSQAEERFASIVQETLTEDEAAAVLSPRPPAALTYNNVFDAIRNMTAGELQPHLEHEHPQVIAYIISRLPKELSARFLLLQTAPVRADIIQRILYIQPVQPVADAMISHALYPALAKQTGSSIKSHYKQISMMLNQLQSHEVDDVLASLDNLKAEDLAGIKAGMFAFEDISRLTDRARLLLFDDISSDTIVKALRNADPALTELVLSSLSKRTRRTVEADLSSPDGLVSQEDILNARREIAETALKLADKGTISLEEEGATD